MRKERSGRYSAAYVGPDLALHRAPETFPARIDAETFPARIDAEGWLAVERRTIDLDQWVPPAQRQRVRVNPGPQARREPAGQTVGSMRRPGWRIAVSATPTTRWPCGRPR